METEQINNQETISQDTQKKPYLKIILIIVGIILVVSVGTAGYFYYQKSESDAITNIVTEKENKKPIITKYENKKTNSVAYIFDFSEVVDAPDKPEAITGSDNMDFGISECQNDSGEYYPWANIIRGAAWKENELFVDALVRLNCCPERVTGSYTIDNDIISLQTEQAFGKVACMCTCNYIAKFVIKDIPKNDYEIKIGDKDSITLTVNNEVKDACVNNPSYSCYKNIYQPKIKDVDTTLASSPIEIVFVNPEDKVIADKYPKFLEYFKKYEPYVYNTDLYKYYEFEFDEEKNYLKLIKRRTRDSTSSRSEGGFVSGESMKAVVIDYIEEIENRYGPNSLKDSIEKKLNLPIVYMAPNESSFRFDYDAEIYEYSRQGVNFINREYDINLRFEPDYPKPYAVDRETIDELVGIANKLYDLIINQPRIDFSAESDFYVTINMDSKQAKFSANNYFSENDPQNTTIIHNKTVVIKQSYSHRYTIDLNTWEVTFE